MKEVVRENRQLIILFLIWILVGFAFGILNLIVVPICLMLLLSKERYVELIVGFLFVLVLSDNRYYVFEWAAQLKNIYILLLGYITIKSYKKIDVKVKIHLFIFPFIFIALICSLNSPTVFVSIQKTLSYFLLFFILPNYFSFLYQKYDIKFIKIIIGLLFFILLIGLIQKYTTPQFANLAGRHRGLLGNPNGLGIFCFLFFCFFTIVVEFFTSIFNKYEIILIYGVIIISLILSGARSSLIASILFIVFRYFNKVSPIFSFAILILTIVSYEYISNNIESIVYFLGIEDYFRLDTIKDGSGRLVAWEFAWKQIQKNFFLGRGFGFNEYIFKENYFYLLNLGHQGSSAHNAYLTFWLDTGLVGLTAFVSGLVSFIINISKKSISVFPLLFAVLFSNQFESWLTASLNPFTILFLLSLSLIFVASKNKILESSQEESSNLDELEVSHA